MARMLQALKNLEARSAKTAGEGWLAQLAEKKPGAAAGATLLRPSPPVVAAPASEADASGPSPAMVRPLRRMALPASAREEVEAPIEPVLPTRVASSKAEIAPTANKHPSPASTRSPSSLERQVLRTLGDRGRSAALVQLADRLRRDAEQTASKTLLVIGVGQSSATHEAALIAAALLAEKHGQQVLLIDADVMRRSLTEGLDAIHSPGLAELLRGGGAFRERCLTTALGGVSLLPAGPLQAAELSGAGKRLEEILQQAAAGYSLVLIDGGRSSDPVATALARLADATYFVVQLGVVEAREAQRALRDFRAASAKVVGCIAT